MLAFGQICPAVINLERCEMKGTHAAAAEATISDVDELVAALGTTHRDRRAVTGEARGQTRSGQ
jgi:hypothetical protein